MLRERRVRSEASVENIAAQTAAGFEEARKGIYEAWRESERGNITPAQRTAKIREVYRLHPRVADDFEELTDVVRDGDFLTVGQLIAKEAKDAVIIERERARSVREEASRASAGQKRYERRTKAQDRRGTNTKNIH
mgnify:CR=1 FL=1